MEVLSDFKSVRMDIKIVATLLHNFGGNSLKALLDMRNLIMYKNKSLTIIINTDGLSPFSVRDKAVTW